MLTIRSKILLLTLALFSIPYMGYEYVREMENYLRDNLETSLVDTAQLLSGVLQERPELFHRQLVDTVIEDNPTVMTSLKTPIQLDGAIDDWELYLNQIKTYDAQYILSSTTEYEHNSLHFQYMLGGYKDHIYALFIVVDDTILYRLEDSLHLHHSDHLQIVLQDTRQQFQRYVITPSEAGWVSAYKLVDKDNHLSAQPETRIQGTWLSNEKGYILELRIPMTMSGERLGFAIADVDDGQQREIKHLIGTSPIRYLNDQKETISIHSAAIEKVIQAVGEETGRRAWVIDKQQRVLAYYGALKPTLVTQPLKQLYQFLFPPAPETLANKTNTLSYNLTHIEIDKALHGEPISRWGATADGQGVIVAAAHPIQINNQIIGTVVVEESSHSIQTIQRQAVASLFNKSVLVFSVVIVSLLLFATHLSIRLRRLRNQAETAIDINGRVTTTQIGSQGHDEIGDLSRSFSTILTRLQQYNHYLEGMVSKLSHELRTPIAVVRSSLDNLEHDDTTQEDKHVYIGRAKQGVQRLNTLITRLTEATRIEQTLQNTERERLNISELITGCLAGYRLAYPRQRFLADIESQQVTIEGAPDLIVQMLDKLVSNAVDFVNPDTAIQISLTQTRQHVQLSVIDEGEILPVDMQERLFESMVSIRKQKGHNEPHLGLGLYMVRLIAAYHGGQVKAENLPENKGAVFTVWLPIYSGDGGL